MEAVDLRRRLQAGLVRMARGAGALPAAGRPPTAPERAGRLVEALLPAHRLIHAEFTAGKWGVTPLEAAVGLRLTTHEAVARALAARIGGSYVALDGALPAVAADPADWRRIMERGAVGIDRPVGGKAILLAARPADAERIAAEARRCLPGHWPRLVTTPAAFAWLIRAWARGPWVDDAVHRLAREEPERSASDRPLMAATARRVAVALVGLALSLTAGPAWLAAGVGGLVGAGVLAWSGLRVAAALTPLQVLPRRRLAERDLPIYTLLCPLYREKRVAGSLLAALARLDYPPAKLDIKLILEADDPETLEAVRAVAGSLPADILVLPPDGPRTKPKALMMALPFARGELLAVYDAEDRPGRGQLREAAETFAAADARLGCLQAPLAIANAGDSWLTRFFAAEYDALFRVLLPAMARFGLPMPLGGTSNHFRLAALRQSLGWDPFNVTEDADLGFRLARNGWRTGTIATPTQEEAPPTFRGWLGQRGRWYKGWLQTLAVLARHPRILAAELGPWGLLALAATLAGSLGSALVHLVCLAALCGALASGGPPPWADLALPVFLAGYLGSIVYKMVGLARAGRYRLAPWLLLLPLAWIAMGLAALLALWQLWRAPFHWEKTEHGLSAAWAALAEGEARPAALAEDELTARVLSVIALTEEALAARRHSPRDIAEALRRQRPVLARSADAASALALFDAYSAAMERRAAGA